MTPKETFLAVREYAGAPGSLGRVRGALRIPNMSETQFVGACLRVLQGNDRLLEAAAKNKPSLLSAMIEAAHTGLAPGLGGLAYFIPRDGKVCYELSYMGYLQLAYKHPRVLNIEPHLVYENDEYDVEYGRRPPILHRPARRNRDAKIIAAWVLTEIAGPDGAVGRNYADFWIEDIYENHRARSQAWRSAEERKKYNSPWHEDEGAMVIKSAIKGARKFIPFTTELAERIARDDARDQGLDVPDIEDEPIAVTTEERKPFDADQASATGQLEGNQQVY